MSEDGKLYDVIVVGSFMYDLIAYVPRVPGPGETLMGSAFSQGFGGKGCNQAVMSKLLGSRTIMSGCLGDDNFGESYKRHLEKEGVETILKPPTCGVATGVALIIVSADGQNQITVVPGANNTLTVDDIMQEDAPIHQAIKSARIVVCQFEIPLAVVEAAVAVGRSSGAIVILNPAPVPSDVEKLSDKVFQEAHIVCPNEVEAGLLCGSTASGESVKEQAERCVKMLKQRGCERPMVTMGADGVLVCDGNGEIHHLPAPKVNAVDSTGAGDCFVGSLAHFMAQLVRSGHCALEKEYLLKAVNSAIRLASESVKKNGTQVSYPRGDDLLSLLNELK